MKAVILLTAYVSYIGFRRKNLHTQLLVFLLTKKQGSLRREVLNGGAM